MCLSLWVCLTVRGWLCAFVCVCVCTKIRMMQLPDIVQYLVIMERCECVCVFEYVCVCLCVCV